MYALLLLGINKLNLTGFIAMHLKVKAEDRLNKTFIICGSVKSHLH